MVDSGAKNFKIVGAGVSIGQPRKGVEKTADILKAEGIENFMNSDKTQWVDIVREIPYVLDQERVTPIRNVREIGEYSKRLFDCIVNNIGADDFLLTIGGDHSIASPSITALLKVHNSNLGIIWLDAHGDCNTPETSPSGNFHGMPVAHALGLIQDDQLMWGQTLLNVSQVAQIGIRDLDPLEKELMDRIGLFYFTMDQVNELGIEHCIRAAMQHVDPNNDKMIHLSLDVDGFDPTLFPGTGTPVPGGLTFDHYNVILSHLRACKERFRSMDLAEINYTIERETTMQNVKEILRLTFT